MNCYNCSKYFDEALQSIINQTYKNWELIFWDNLSNDNSKEIFKKYNDKRFKYFLAEKHTVLYEARNLAIKEAKGELIAFLDSDDYWKKNKLEFQLKEMKKKNSDVIFTGFEAKNEKNKFLYRVKSPAIIDFELEKTPSVTTI